MPETIVVLDQIPDEWAVLLRKLMPTNMVLHSAPSSSEEDLKQLISQADYAIAVNASVTADMLGSAVNLKLLHKWGVGVDNLDLEAARRLSVKVARTTGSNAIPVAEFAIGLMLSALRCISHSNAAVKNGNWEGGSLPTQTFMLSNKTVGIIGLGAIGKTVAKLLQGFGCQILYNKTTPLDRKEEVALGAEFAEFPDLLSRSDIVCLCCPLTPQTVALIDRLAFQQMKSTAVLINVARGGVVVENDLIWALRSGTIMAAAMDVFEIEPLPKDSPLLGLDNLVLTPHIAANASDNFEKTVSQMMSNIARVARGEQVAAQDIVP
ncbi:2-hydroxyacid dehydrogenase [Agrobacterium vitis]|uniref:2-hydroxyacid dehydrogenase n=1 Tax=Agrobacterium vitis TaxID=373 RepID=UPI0012E81252|nr:2-hydroxyacid dehydrogenase [Agrobacterium vitis]MVA64073.1 3-phosphoglycerate dehydrogenase [Agrobacterium vitis]